MMNSIKKTKNLFFFSLPLIGMMMLGGCKEEEKILAHCDSQFIYEGSPFKEGDEVVINPTYTTGADVIGQFSANPGLVFLDREKGTIDIGASVPGTYMVRKAMLNNSNCGGRIQFAEVKIIAPEPPNFFNNVDNTTGWSVSGPARLDMEDKKQGVASLKADVNPGTIIFSHSPSSPVDAKVTMDNGIFKFWLYLSNPDIIGDGPEEGQIELTSSGGPDKQELTWSINKGMNFKEGWNEIVLKFSDARVSGEPVKLNALNFFRLYIHTKGGAPAITIGIDDLRFQEIK